jgi:hypothetical protein
MSSALRRQRDTKVTCCRGELSDCLHALRSAPIDIVLLGDGPSGQAREEATGHACIIREIARFYCTGEEGDILVATSTSNKTALSRMLPAITSSASDATGCCSASESKRLLTLLRF